MRELVFISVHLCKFAENTVLENNGFGSHHFLRYSDETAQGFAHCSDINTAGMVRVSFGIYNNEEEVDKFLELMPSVMEAAKAEQTITATSFS